MQQVRLLIDKFQKHINMLNEGNLVIGGIHALDMHGLVMHRDAVDFDVIIYSPSENQEDYLEALIEKGEAKDDSGEEKYRSYKIEQDGVCIDFLLERDKDMPENLLYFVHSSQQMHVQSIENVIEAKRSYFDGFEFRPKDVDDCRELKANNFDLFKKDKPVDWEKLEREAKENPNGVDDLPF